MTQVDSSGGGGGGLGGRFNDLGQKKEPFMVLMELFYVNGPFAKATTHPRARRCDAAAAPPSLVKQKIYSTRVFFSLLLLCNVFLLFLSRY